MMLQIVLGYYMGFNCQLGQNLFVRKVMLPCHVKRCWNLIFFNLLIYLYFVLAWKASVILQSLSLMVSVAIIQLVTSPLTKMLRLFKSLVMLHWSHDLILHLKRFCAVTFVFWATIGFWSDQLWIQTVVHWLLVRCLRLPLWWNSWIDQYWNELQCQVRWRCSLVRIRVVLLSLRALWNALQNDFVDYLFKEVGLSWSWPIVVELGVILLKVLQTTVFTCILFCMFVMLAVEVEVFLRTASYI